MLVFRTTIITIILLCFAATSHAWTGKVLNVSTGDSITVLHEGTQVKVRLYGIAAPKQSQPYWQKAKSMTSAFVAGKIVDVSLFDTDRNGLSVGLVTVGSKNLNRTLVKTGYAWVYDAYCKQSFCGDWKGLELQARAAKLGLWQDSSPIPPWQWRRGNNSITSKTKNTRSKNPNLLGVGPAGKIK